VGLNRSFLKVPRDDLHRAFEEGAFHDDELGCYWIKLHSRVKTLRDSEPVMSMDGGTGALYGASYIARCKNGHFVKAEKNRHYHRLAFTDLFDGDDSSIREHIELYESIIESKWSRSHFPIPDIMHYADPWHFSVSQPYMSVPDIIEIPAGLGNPKLLMSFTQDIFNV
jgi:hypothetical protein